MTDPIEFLSSNAYFYSNNSSDRVGNDGDPLRKQFSGLTFHFHKTCHYHCSQKQGRYKLFSFPFGMQVICKEVKIFLLYSYIVNKIKVH